MDINFNIGGEAGQGIDTIGDLLTQLFVRACFYTHTIKSYESRIRGGYNFTQIRVSNKPIFAPLEEIDIIIALSEDAIVRKRDALVDGGVIIFDESIDFTDLESCHFPAPLEKIAKQLGGTAKMTNAAALGALLSVLSFPFDMAEEALSAIFKKKGKDIISANIDVAKSLYDLTQKEFKSSCRHDLQDIEKGPCHDRLLLTGSQGIAFGAMAAGLKWISSYPMSPSTSVFDELMAASHELEVGALQTEDEIASLTMAIGASYAGARSMVTTSGGGFSLMVEGLGLAAMTETPVVIYNAQRGGPSTGLPTRTEQSDLLFLLNASQGEFPRIMFAPKDPIEGFEVTVRAFNLADKYQVPVLILGDQHFADSILNLPNIDVANVEIDRGKIAGKSNNYERYHLTDDGISPRAFPGDKDKVVVSSGNCHLEDGHVTEDPVIRKAMVEKFFKKVPQILEDLNPPQIYGEERADTTLLTWGSTWGAANEASKILSSNDVSINQLHFCDLYPLRDELLMKVFDNSDIVIAVEQNATSQFAKLVRMETGLSVTHRINKYDGRPMTAKWILSELREVGIE
ncbi:MAG: 2-oxoacid:acceptor oxidoreductase subunit alpha [Candidatus Lokiarchaeota archaeon]|nr:2-oxoacid:acceptor oxidoreductase subunit alpha [Candidatus Lokiarchaeota archaeon]